MKKFFTGLLSILVVTCVQADGLKMSVQQREDAAAPRRRAVRRSIPTTPADWVRQNSMVLASTDLVTDDSDLLPLKTWLHDVRVIGLGDGTHGTHEYYTVKKRLINFLAR